MPIKFACPAGHLLNVADRLAGQEVRCLRCGKMVAVPSASTSIVEPAPITVEPLHEPPVPSIPTSPIALPVPAVSAQRSTDDVAAPPVTLPANGPAPNSPPMSPPVAPPIPRPPALPGYECPASERNAVLGIACGLGAMAFSLAAPAFYEIAEHLAATTSTGVARWAFALLALALLHVAYAVYLWQAPDWASVFTVALVELGQAMLLAFALGLLLASKTDHTLVEWLDLTDAARSELAHLWCFFALALASAVAFWSGRYGLAWRRRLAA